MNKQNQYFYAKNKIAKIVNEVIDFYAQNGDIHIHGLKLIWDMAININQNIARAGLEGLFPMYVERLSDSFSSSAVDHYNQAFVEIITYSRNHPCGRQMDKILSQFGLFSKESLIQRRTKPGNNLNNFYMDRLNKIFILSRFSVGAEIAINGVIINSLCTNCPTAEIFLVGPEKNGILFKNIPQVNLLVCDYPKKGSLFDRFNAWLNLLEIIEVNTKHLNQEEYLIIDADSRLTQLGLLPVIKNEERYLFFDSRSYHEHSHATLGELTGSWLTKGLGIQAKPSKISIPQESKIYSSFICENLVEDSPIIAISYGTGNNSLKQLPFEIEFNLVLELLKGSSGTILLLSGIQPVELEQKNKLFSLLTSKEYINGINISGNKIDAITKYKKSRLIAWDGPLAEYCALISIADYHIGYDSSGQHIAAALGIPTVDIFVDPTNTESFINRWTPTSSARVEVLRLPQNNNVDTTVQLIIDAWKRLSLF